MLPLLLASSSIYRRELLAVAAAIYLQLAGYRRKPSSGRIRHRAGQALAEEKARALAGSHIAHLIIGSDQVAVLGERMIGKPHTFEKAREQFLASAGASVTFLTGLALLNSQTGECRSTACRSPYTCAHSISTHRTLSARRTTL